MRSLLVTSALLLALGGCNRATGPTNGATADARGATAPASTTVEATGSAASNGAYGPGLVTTPRFAEAAAISDMYEIASSRLALQHARSAAVKRYAQQMIDEHTQTTAKLKLAVDAGHLDQAPPKALDDRHAAMMEKLGKAEPDKFDALYLDQQTQSHREALGLMESYLAHGDNPSFKVFAAETKPKVQKHLGMAAELDHAGVDDPKKAG